MSNKPLGRPPISEEDRSTCIVPTCTAKAHVKKLCRTHYQIFRRLQQLWWQVQPITSPVIKCPDCNLEIPFYIVECVRTPTGLKFVCPTCYQLADTANDIKYLADHFSGQF